MSEVSALILAGGKATRFGGVAKHELRVEGQTILSRQVAVLGPRVAEILVSQAHDMPGSSPRDTAGFRSVRDATEGVGPLAGIAAGLAACTTPWLLVVAGDMPYITGELVDQLIARLDDGIDAVGIRIDGLPEPLLCVLHARVVATVERRIAGGDFKASRLLTDSGLRVHWLDDVDRAVVRNINAPADL